MDEYLVELGGYEYAVEAASEQEARQKALLAHVKSVGQQSVSQAEAGAVSRSEAPPEVWNPGVEAAMAGMSGEGGAYADPNATGADILKRGAGMASMLAAGATAPAMAAAPVATTKSLLGGLIGSAVGNEAGQWAGRRVPIVGGETLGNVLGGVGGLVAGGGGMMVAPKLGAKELLSMLPGGGRGGMLSSVLGGAESQAARSVAPEAAAAAARKLELDLAAKEATIAVRREQARRIAAREARDAEAHAVKMEALKQKAAGKPGPKLVPDTPKAAPPPTSGANALKPEPDVLPEEAVSLVAEPLPFKPKGQTRLPTVYTKGPAKPGPAPTPPDKLEETLRASIEAAKAKKPSPATVEKALTEAAQELNDEGLRVPRIAVGAQRVGRQVGMTKEAVRQASGPILNETRGEASPIFPRQALESIVDKIRTIPMAERDAYVRAATSDKAMWQVETIRRTLEKLGLLLPVGAAAGAMNTE